MCIRDSLSWVRRVLRQLPPWMVQGSRFSASSATVRWDWRAMLGLLLPLLAEWRAVDAGTVQIMVSHRH
eukprot:4632332-Prorocentrum_lima.AAC.1